MLKHETYQPPSDATLREKRLEFLKDCKPKALREMRKSGHKREARWVAIGVALAGGALAAHNMRMRR